MGQGAYTLDDLQPDAPQQTGKYNLNDLEGAPDATPTPPTYLGEAAAGVGRGLKSVFYDLPKDVIMSMGTPGGYIQKAGTDLYHGMEQATTAADRAAAQGEGRAGQTYEYLSNLPFVGGLVRKAGEAGPGYAKFSPQTLGAVSEATTLYGAPKLAAELPGALNKVIPSTKRGGAGIGILEKTFADHPMPVDEPYAVAKNIRDELAKTNSQDRVHRLIDDYRENIDSRDTLRNPETRAEVEADAATRNKPSPSQVQDQLADPRTFDGARAYLREANQLIQKGNLNDLQREQLQRFAGALSKSIDEGVAQSSPIAPGGFANDYQAMKAEVRRGSKVIRGAEKVGPLVGGALGAAAGDLASNMLHVGNLGKAESVLGGAAVGRAIGKPIIGGMVRRVMSREAGPPALPSINETPMPLPPASSSTSFYGKTQQQYLRDMMLRAKAGEISPTRLDQLGIPKTRRIPQPPEDTE